MSVVVSVDLVVVVDFDGDLSVNLVATLDALVDGLREQVHQNVSDVLIPHLTVKHPFRSSSRRDRAGASARTRTRVTFITPAFNTSTSRPYFINPGCFGDDLLLRMRDLLRADGISTDDEPRQEDFGWFLRFKADSIEHCLVVGHRPRDGAIEGQWIGWVERSRGLLLSLFGRRRVGIRPSALRALHRAVLQLPGVDHVRWHHEDVFDAGDESRGTSEPDAI